jgi:hypothetical protein
MRERFFDGSLAEGEALVFFSSPSFFSLSEEMGFAPEWRSSSFLFIGDDWRGRPEAEEEEEDMAAGEEGFFGAGG